MTGPFRHWRRAFRDIGLIAVALWGLSYLPPDTSWREREKVGVLRYCVPSLISPLITTATGAAGPELTLVQGIARDIGLKLHVIEASNIGRSFNPADWNITRGQCDVLGGGVADTRLNRGFVTLLPTGQSLGLHLLGASEAEVASGQEVGVYLGSAGLDRLKLSAWMRQKGWRARALRDEAALNAWLSDGKVAIAPSLVVAAVNVPVEMLPSAAAQTSPLALALWRGDMTLTRKIRKALENNL